MSLRLFTIIVDAEDHRQLGRWWAETLDWSVMFEGDDQVVITTPDERYPGIVFVPVPESKTGKNRIHLDLNPDDQDAEVERLLARGATPVEVGQTGDERWVVLADPEGNEFCVTGARDGGM